MSIWNEQKKYAQARPARFHTPGHKGVPIGVSGLDAALPLDITELSFSDDYFCPDGIIRGAMDKARDFYESAETFLLVNGSTIGILAALYATAQNGAVLVGKNSHRAIYCGIELARATVHAIDLTPDSVKNALNNNNYRAVVVTSPDYYGFCADIKGIAEVCRARDVVLIADASHGAHFPASPFFPDFRGADITVNSAHKTMHALTQGSFLNVYNSGLVEAVRNALFTFASTSPSYLIMASLERAIELARSGAQHYAELHRLIIELKKNLPFVQNDDFTRLVLDCKGQNTDEICAKLEKFGIFAEKHDGRYIIFIVTLADTRESLNRLQAVLLKVLK